MATTQQNLTIFVTKEEMNALLNNIDDMFLIINAILISLMQAGFGCLEAGCVNSKNVTNIILKNVLDMFLAALSYWIIGYSFAYSSGNFFLGEELWAGFGFDDAMMSHWFFQFVFAATAATIISGAVAERCNFVAYIVYNLLISGVVYPIATHWTWTSEGWLNQIGYTDFAGSGVVHLLGGVCSFVGAFFLGPRLGRFVDGNLVEKPGHSVPLIGIGGLLLVTGFLAFNGGSLGHITLPGDGDIVARCLTNTIMAGTGAAVVILVLGKTGLIGPRIWYFSITLNAILAGIVSSCAGVDVFTTFGALLSGFCGAVFYVVVRYIVLFLKVDDPLEAVAVHFGGGFCGLITRPVFGRNGLIYGGGGEAWLELAHNLLGFAALTAWAALTSIIIFGGLKLIGRLRVNEEQEIEGLDISKHNEPAYPKEGWHYSDHHHSPHVDNHNERNKRIYFSNGFDNIGLEMDNQFKQ